MPVVKKIHICNYKNIRGCSLSLSERVNCISGDNAQGKTNLLEALYHLCLCKNPNALADKNIYTFGEDAYSIVADVEMPDGLTKFQIISKDGTRSVKKDDKEYERVSDHIGQIPLVMISPADMEMVSSTPETRRKFLNSLLSQTDKEYLHALMQYNRLLQHRNALLKRGELTGELIDIIGGKMSEHAQKIYTSRKALIEALSPLVTKYYSQISQSDSEIATLSYSTGLTLDNIPTLFKDSLNRDAVMQYTTVGPQRDDLDFLISGHSLRQTASQGQKKSFIVALKMAQYEIMKERFGYGPLILLDDVFDRLDYGRVVNLLRMVAESDFGQIFITDCNKERLSRLIEEVTSESAFYEVKNGEFTRL